MSHIGWDDGVSRRTLDCDVDGDRIKEQHDQLIEKTD